MEGLEGNQKHVQNESGQSGMKNNRVCLYGDKVIICDRKRNILIEVDVSNDDVKEFSGKGECKSADRRNQMDILLSVVLHNHFLCVVKKKTVCY